jgi:hypothetical protein
MSFSEFLSELKSTSDYVEPGETRRLYGKDYACPREWAQWLDHAAILPDILVPNGTENALNNLPNSVRDECIRPGCHTLKQPSEQSRDSHDLHRQCVN